MALSGFFVCEVCRKLDPDAPPLKATYLIVYGRQKTLLMVAAGVAVGAVAAEQAHLSRLLWPVEAAMLAACTLTLALQRPGGNTGGSTRRFAWHKFMELLSLLYLLLHLWAEPILRQYA